MSPRNWGARWQDSAWHGEPAVVLENEALRVTVLLDGGHVVECDAKRRDLDLVWLSPNGRRRGGGWFDAYPGGWQVMLPNAGAPSAYRGAEFGQHDEVAVLPWERSVVADGVDEVAVRFRVRTVRTPLRLARVLRLRRGCARLSVTEELTNESAVEVPVMWGQHLAFGAPFLRPGHRVTLPHGVRVIPHPSAIVPPRRAVAPGGPYPWPVVPTPSGGTVDLSVVPEPGAPSDIAYLTGFPEGWYEIRDPADGYGVRVTWDATVLPYLWLWHELGDTTGYPWWGRAYVVGVEPCSSYPTNGLAEAVANGTALRLSPQGTRALEWSIGVVGDE